MAYVIVGLGNPGHAYEKTRHNAGRLAVEALAKAEGFPAFQLKKTANALISEGTLAGEKVILVLPETMMNLSGKAVAALVKSKPAAKKMLIVRDELDMPLGTMKMTYGRGSGGHKGAESVMRALKTKQFGQIKIGISGHTAKGALKKPAHGEKVIKHVVGKWKPDEEKALKKLFAKANEAMRTFVEQDAEAAMLVANTK